MKNIFFTVVFQIGVNVIGIPDFHQIKVSKNRNEISLNKTSKFHK